MNTEERLKSLRSLIYADLDQLQKHVYSFKELQSLLHEKKTSKAWYLPYVEVSDLIEFLNKSSLFKTVNFEFPSRKIVRYLWRSPNLYSVLLSLRPKSHFSHFTAMQMHDLTEQDPRVIYLNFEQSEKFSKPMTLNQEGIDQAFSKEARKTSQICDYQDFQVCLLNGKYTQYLGVESRQFGEDSIRVTDLERTLIDITVRSIYAGGPAEVLKAYERSGGQASSSRIAAYLKQMEYIYPYHQCIGFYMEASGAFKSSAIDRFEQKHQIEHDFYLTHGMKKTRYVNRWRLYVPEWM